MSGMTQAELAAKMHTSAPSLNKRIQNGKFTQEELEAIGAALGATYKSGFYFPDGNKVE